MMPKLIHVVVAASLYITTGAWAAAQQRVPEQGRGKEFALTLCADCHVVASDQQQRPMHAQQIPSFAAIANRPNTTVDSLRRFIKTTHSSMAEPSRMPVMAATDYQIDEISNYILTLRNKR